MKEMKEKFFILYYLLLTSLSFAQQIPDTAFCFPIPVPAYPKGQGPLITLDEAHFNFHTLDGRYFPFGKVLKNDGYRLNSNQEKFSSRSLAEVKILVIANALGDEGPWVLPTRPAFADKEIEAVSDWVKKGGSLFLIADHMPFAGAAEGLAAAFGFQFQNAFAVLPNNSMEIFSRQNKRLKSCAITDGNSQAERVDSLLFFAGQAFYAPEKATVISALDSNYQVLFPQVAWQFHDTTRTLSGEGLVNGAYMNFGKGKVVVMGEAAMFSAQLAGSQQSKIGMNHPQAKYNPQLLLNIIHWLDQNN